LVVLGLVSAVFYPDYESGTCMTGEVNGNGYVNDCENDDVSGDGEMAQETLNDCEICYDYHVFAMVQLQTKQRVRKS